MAACISPFPMSTSLSAPHDLSIRIPSAPSFTSFLYPPFQPERFRFQKKLADSIYGTVGLFYDEEKKVDVAIKSCDRAEAHRNDTPEFTESPYRELRVMEELKEHTNIHFRWGLHNEVLESPYTLYIVFPYHNGFDLFTHITTRDPTQAVDTQRWFYKLAKPLYDLHLQGYAHHDFSLENCMLDYPPLEDENDLADPELYLIDFGAAVKLEFDPCEKTAGQFGFKRLTSSPSNAKKRGKIPYMSPEAYTPDKTYDAIANDLFSLGVTFFTLVFGVPPFKKPNYKTDEAFALWYQGLSSHVFEQWKLDLRSTPLLRQFLSRLICPERRRMTWVDIWAHEWWGDFKSGEL